MLHYIMEKKNLLCENIFSAAVTPLTLLRVYQLIAGWSYHYHIVLPSSSVSVAGWAPLDSIACPAVMRYQVSATPSLSLPPFSPLSLQYLSLWFYSITTNALVITNFTSQCSELPLQNPPSTTKTFTCVELLHIVPYYVPTPLKPGLHSSSSSTCRCSPTGKPSDSVFFFF